MKDFNIKPGLIPQILRILSTRALTPASISNLSKRFVSHSVVIIASLSQLRFSAIPLIFKFVCVVILRITILQKNKKNIQLYNFYFLRLIDIQLNT